MANQVVFGKAPISLVVWEAIGTTERSELIIIEQDILLVRDALDADWADD